ncbi:MAG: hypothetical protein HOQ11_06785 [Gemmatimonadaceae bacterium]|nr:hypothetical protein [Gemmatimonadaceae bacterium]NUQ94478.1 hypothetical protein [Gemmatimonadaceae bacterium]NUR32450.1 hypothetical protein [Gemmatimonadaceae bacterium]NUS97095.1 hypothetical protein [Gemmatimonadaceae bacterium]
MPTRRRRDRFVPPAFLPGPVLPYPSPVISTFVSRLSAAVLLLAGLTLLFAADAVLPAVVPGFPRSASWLGQLLAAAWLGLAAVNWLQRAALLGGIYGRPVVMANAVLYLVSGLGLLRALIDGAAPRAMWVACVIALAFAIVYGALMLRGPFDRLRNTEIGKG